LDFIWWLATNFTVLYYKDELSVDLSSSFYHPHGYMLLKTNEKMARGYMLLKTNEKMARGYMLLKTNEKMARGYMLLKQMRRWHVGISS
jgi:hypothetical protein